MSLTLFLSSGWGIFFSLAEPNCDVAAITLDAANNAKELVYQVLATPCRPFIFRRALTFVCCLSLQSYNDAPEIDVVTPKIGHYNKDFAYIPSHLYHIMFEASLGIDSYRVKNLMALSQLSSCPSIPADEELDASSD